MNHFPASPNLNNMRTMGQNVHAFWGDTRH